MTKQDNQSNKKTLNNVITRQTEEREGIEGILEDSIEVIIEVIIETIIETIIEEKTEETTLERRYLMIME
jgi:hypothetical protein